MVLNLNRTTKLQWKLDTIKNCKYLQCTWCIGLKQSVELNLSSKAIIKTIGRPDFENLSFGLWFWPF